MSDDIQQETKRIHRNIVESLSFSEALANRDAEIARLMKELEGADRIANNFAQTACLRGAEIERLRRLLREAADAERDHYATQVSVLMKSGWYKRIRETLGDE
jgi:hypothetical protein